MSWPTVYVVGDGERPSVVPANSAVNAGKPIPADWHIFNSTLPLVGLVWTDVPVVGQFYTAVARNAWMRLDAITQLQATELRYITFAEYKGIVDAWWASLLDIEYANEDMSWLDFSQIETAFRSTQLGSKYWRPA